MLFLTELLANYKGSLSISGNAEQLPISGIASDSRLVGKGSLFIAVKGNNNDGGKYIDAAIGQGAIAVLTDSDSQIDYKDIAVVKVDNVRLALAQIAATFYSSKPQNIAAITGTDGKTSTADFFRQLWQMTGKRAASIGTLGIIGSKHEDSNAINTTPDPISLNATLQNMAIEHCDYVAIEASSHGLSQYRLDGLPVKAAAFTNLTRDHLDYHETLENYFHAKARLFGDVLQPGGTAVLNADDAKFRRLKEICDARNIKVISYGFKGSDYIVKKITPTLEGLAVQSELNGTSSYFMLNILGSFQVMNAFAALGLYVGCGGDLQEGLKHLPHLHNVQGRVERVATHPSGAAIFVDYAHTPAALGNLLKTMRPHVKGRLVVVFGCGGERDKGKRPEMGKAAAEFADKVIVTDDNPRSENPEQIRKEIIIGASGAENIADRGEAIAYAIKSLQANDVLLIAGKGHEKTQIIGEQIIPFNDAEVARNIVKEIA